MKHGLPGCVIAILFFAGCANVPTFPEPDRTWQTFRGQLQYVTEGNRVIGEFEVSRRDGEFRLEFSKGGAVPLIRVSRHQQYGRAEGALARGRWEGLAANAPDALSGWINEVPRGFAGLGTIEQAAKSAARTPGVLGGSAPRRMEIEGTRAGERFVFIFGQ